MKQMKQLFLGAAHLAKAIDVFSDAEGLGYPELSLPFPFPFTLQLPFSFSSVGYPVCCILVFNLLGLVPFSKAVTHGFLRKNVWKVNIF